MKKILMAASALAVSGGTFAAAPAAADDHAGEGFQLKIGGFYNALAIVRDQDDPVTGFERVEPDQASPITGTTKGNIQSFDFNQRGRYIIEGSQTLDNGLTLGFQTQHEIQSSMDTDSAYVYASGGFGRIHFGTDRSAMYKMYEWSPTAGWGIDYTGHDDSFAHLNGMGHPTAAPFIANQEMMLTYLTPRFSGLQAGISFAPAADGLGGKGDPWDAGRNNRFVTDTSSLDDNEYRKVVEMGLNYSQSFDGFDIGWSGGFGTGRTAGETSSDDRRRYLYSTGLNVGFGGFDIGATYKFDTHGSTTALTANHTGNLLSVSDVGATGMKNQHFVNAGITYTTGPWTIGPSFGWEKETAGLERETMLFDFGARYALAPGADLVGSIQYVDYDEGDLDDYIPSNAADDFGGDGVAGLFGIQLNF
ncbi:porin [Fodinicurvata halophila]|uniref:Porin n=1 Tax=Fodinicurvata halophila TaxID=1419723 RepID=A0ABV8UM62_9PROT